MTSHKNNNLSLNIMSNNSYQVFDLPTKPFTVIQLQDLFLEFLVALQDAINKLSDEYDKQTQTLVDGLKQPNGATCISSDNIINQRKNQKVEYLKYRSNTLEDTLIQPVVQYINQYYFEISRGRYYKYDVISDEFELMDAQSFMSEVIVKVDKKDFFNKYFKKNNRIFRICANIYKPRLYCDNQIYYINECRGFLHKTPRPFNSFSEDTKQKCQKVLDYIKEIICGDSEKFFNAYELYLSQICKGQKTEVIPYHKSPEGTGKSTFVNFLVDFVLGEGVCLISGSEPLTSNFNKIFLGKLLIIFEELPLFTTSSWSAVSSKLKTLATESKAVYRDLYEKAIQAENISNFMINTNVDAIKDSNGRRIIIAPINTSRVGDYKFFEDFRNSCLNIEVGECFFSYMLEKDTSQFYAQAGFPETDLKRIATAELLPPHEKFLKIEFVMKHIGIDKIKPSELYDMYKIFCMEINKKCYGKNDFIKKLEQLGIIYKKLNGNNYYKVSSEELKAIATKHKWLCKYDEELKDENDDEEESDEEQDDKTTKKFKHYEHKIKRRDREIEKLKEELAALKKNLRNYNYLEE